MSESGQLRRKERSFLALYGLALIMAFSPSKALGQLAPLIFLAGLILFAQVQPRTHLLRFSGLAIGLAGVGAIYYYVAPEFSVINYIIVIVTLSSFLMLLCDFRYLASPALLRKVSNITLAVLAFEALYGIAQALVGVARNGSFDIANGDIVRGTVEPGFLPTTTGGNAIFAILLSSLLLFVLATAGPRLSIWRLAGYGLVLLAWILASVLHTILFLGAAMVAAVILQQRLRPLLRASGLPRRRWLVGWIVGGVGLAFTVALVITLLPTNLSSLSYFARATLSFDENTQSGKAIATYRTLVVAPQEYPLQPLIGFGPGQYSSRAALIRSGRYLSVGSLGLPPYTSQATERYIMTIWESTAINVRASSTLFPFYSWLSLYGETGLLGLCIVGGALLWAALMLRRRRSAAFPNMHLLLTILMLYIFILGIQDNYWEFTQAIFPAILCWKLSYTALRTEHRTRVALTKTQAASSPPMRQAGLAGQSS